MSTVATSIRPRPIEAALHRLSSGVDLEAKIKTWRPRQCNDYPKCATSNTMQCVPHHTELRRSKFSVRKLCGRT